LALLATVAPTAQTPIRLPVQTAPPTPDPAIFNEMRWRNIGPLRAGRTKAMAGVAPALLRLDDSPPFCRKS
jgi:hypothetical protein